MQRCTDGLQMSESIHQPLGGSTFLHQKFGAIFREQDYHCVE